MEALPEGFIAAALSLTSPREACTLALVSSSFCSAAQSDAVWEPFLPPDYKHILSRSAKSNQLLSLPSKKDLYFYLCHHPILIDDDTKSFSLERWSGKKCFMLAARNLDFDGDDTDRACRWISVPESRFSQVADLFLSCREYFCGKIKTSMLSPNTTYSAFLVFTPDIYGSHFLAVDTKVWISGQESETRGFCLYPNILNPDQKRLTYRVVRRSHPRMFPIKEGQDCEFPKKRDDEWTEVLVEEFHTKEGQDCEMEISLSGGTVSNRESGLLIEGIEFRPKET